MLKLNFKDDLDYSDYLDNRWDKVKKCKEDMQRATLAKVKSIYNQIDTVTNEIFDHHSTVKL